MTHLYVESKKENRQANIYREQINRLVVTGGKRRSQVGKIGEEVKRYKLSAIK